MAGLAVERCFGCDCDDCYLGMGFWVEEPTPTSPGPGRNVLGGQAGRTPMRPGQSGRIAYTGWLCTRCCQIEARVRDFARAIGAACGDDLRQGGGVWSHQHQADAMWDRVRPAVVARERARELGEAGAS